MNKANGITGAAGVATAQINGPYLGDALDEATAALNLVRAASLLFRHLVLEKLENEAVTISRDHAETISSLVELAWNKSSDTVDEIKTLWGRAAR